MWATTHKEDLEHVNFGYAQWRKCRAKKLNKLAHDRRAWAASLRDTVNCIGDSYRKYKLPSCFFYPWVGEAVVRTWV